MFFFHTIGVVLSVILPSELNNSTVFSNGLGRVCNQIRLYMARNRLIMITHISSHLLITCLRSLQRVCILKGSQLKQVLYSRYMIVHK